jgi:hypothetical protein
MVGPPAVALAFPNGFCPNHSTGVNLPPDFKVSSLQYVD